MIKNIKFKLRNFIVKTLLRLVSPKVATVRVFSKVKLRVGGILQNVTFEVVQYLHENIPRYEITVFYREHTTDLPFSIERFRLDSFESALLDFQLTKEFVGKKIE